MINLNLEKIIDCTATEAELKSFFSQNRQKLDLANSFEKYFSVEKIENALNLYRAEKISAQYLSLWATAYCWILLASHWHGEKTAKGMQNLKDNLVEAIGEQLDSVSFFEESDNASLCLEEIFCDVKMYYQIYTTLPQWETFYCENKFYNGKENVDVKLLCVNKLRKTFLIFDGALAEKNELAQNKLAPLQFAKKTTELKQFGFLDASPSQQNTSVAE